MGKLVRGSAQIFAAHVYLYILTLISKFDSHHSTAENKNKDKRELRALVCLKTDYEDNKMKKDTLATLHDYTTNHLLSNLHINISKILNNEQNQWFFKIFCEHYVNKFKKQKNTRFYNNQKHVMPGYPIVTNINKNYQSKAKPYHG